MKKFTAILLVLVCLFALAACGKKASGTMDLEKAQADVEALGILPASMMSLDNETLSALYGINADTIEKQLSYVPMMNVHASGYWLLLPKSGSEDTVKTAMNTYMESYQAQWDQYLPDQAELVRGRTETTIETAEGTWLLYVISDNNDAVVSAIQGAVG